MNGWNPVRRTRGKWKACRLARSNLAFGYGQNDVGHGASRPPWRGPYRINRLNFATCHDAPMTRRCQGESFSLAIQRPMQTFRYSRSPLGLGSAASAAGASSYAFAFMGRYGRRTGE